MLYNIIIMAGGNVYVASMNMRGKRWEPPASLTKVIKLNVTSAQQTNHPNRLAFSPMTPIAGGYKGYWNFESYWQSGKVYADLDNVAVQCFWRNNKAPKRRYPGSRDKRVLYAEFDDYPGVQMDYVTSRKKVYIPEYHALIERSDIIQKYLDLLDEGHNVIVYDFDGPRKANGDVHGLAVTLDMLIDKIADVRYPFGHGYVVGATLADIHPDAYCW